jgi:peptidoglycan/LPS O-acetylase OafA/YrhL
MTIRAKRGGNFDAIRLISAAAVLFGHSFIVGVDSEQVGFLAKTANALSIAAVETFFILSGYLVTGSFERRSSVLRFVLARLLRIFPGLVVCVLVSALVFAPLLTTMQLGDYFKTGQYMQFIAYNSLLDVWSFPFLPGVSFHDGMGGNTINGSLWSLPFEFSFYSIILIVGALRQLNGRVAVALLILALIGRSVPAVDGIGWFLQYFATGMCMYFLRKLYRFDGRLVGLAGLAAVILYFAGAPSGVFPILGGFFVIGLAVDAPVEMKHATRFGDLSYGVYLYGWPVEEIVARGLGGHAPWWQIFPLALPLCGLAAWLSWHCVERRLLGWKDARLRGVRRHAGVAAALTYGATAILFGVAKLFLLGALLPAALTLTIAQIIFWATGAVSRRSLFAWGGEWVPRRHGERGTPAVAAGGRSVFGHGPAPAKSGNVDN